MFAKHLLFAVVIGSMLTTLGYSSILLMPGAVCPNQDIGCSVASSATLSALDPTFVLPNDPGTVHLPIFVVPGDVVLFETANGSLTDPSTWSDVVEFHDVPGVQGSFATTFPDAEPVGILLPSGFTLSSNAVGLGETTVGSGNDAIDFTTYVAGTGDFSATYLIHSDAALNPEPSEPIEGTPEPITLPFLVAGLATVFLFGRHRLQ